MIQNKVTVLITTYNLEEYIEETLTSVCEQETNFGYEVLVADDASTDSTIDIIKACQKKYPNKIQLYMSKTNKGSLANSNRIFNNLKSEYFTFLDGDDYWNSNDFLQKRVDFLDKNKDYVMCASNTNYLKDKVIDGTVIDEKKTNKSYGFDQYLDGTIPFVHTSSILVRNIIFSCGLPPMYEDAVGEYKECALRGEYIRFLLHLNQGKIYVMSDIDSTYRIHSKGMWQGASRIRRILEGTIQDYFLFEFWRETYPQVFEQRFVVSYKSMMKEISSIINEKYCLSEYDTFLYTSLLKDISKDTIKWDMQGEMNGLRGIIHRFIHLLKY